MDQELRRIEQNVAATLDFIERSGLSAILLELQARLEEVNAARQAYAEARGFSLPDLGQSEGASPRDVAIASYYPLGVGSPLSRLLGLPRELRQFMSNVAVDRAA